MNETIYTIPINKAFDRYDGCPACALHTGLEQASLEYIMGAAMMEPDVRIKTNRQGFCGRHLNKMLGEKNKLALALMLGSHLSDLDAGLFERAAAAKKKDPGLNKIRADASAVEGGCFLCGRASLFMDHYYENIIYLWRKEPDFQDKFNRQPFFCLPHYVKLLNASERGLTRGERAEYYRELTNINRAYLRALSGDLAEFCSGFDYRSAALIPGEAAVNSVERAVKFLSGAFE